jgi:hypothetical protein
VHVGLQVGSQPQFLVPGDAVEARWSTEVRVVQAPVGRRPVRRRAQVWCYVPQKVR